MSEAFHHDPEDTVDFEPVTAEDLETAWANRKKPPAVWSPKVQTQSVHEDEALSTQQVEVGLDAIEVQHEVDRTAARQQFPEDPRLTTALSRLHSAHAMWLLSTRNPGTSQFWEYESGAASNELQKVRDTIRKEKRREEIDRQLEGVTNPVEKAAIRLKNILHLR